MSLNLCTDQLLASLLPSYEIIGLSPLAHDCAEAVICEEARSLPVARAEGEDVLNHHPTHILESQWGHSSVTMIARLRSIAYYQLPVAQRLADIPQQIQALARWLNVPERGDSLARMFERQLEQDSHVSGASPSLTAVFYSESDDPLLEDMLAKTGFLSLSGTYDHYRIFSPEILLVSSPDLLVISSLGAGPSLKEKKLLPDFLWKRFAGSHFLAIPAKFTLCGIPQSLDAVRLLTAAHIALSREKERL